MHKEVAINLCKKFIKLFRVSQETPEFEVIYQKLVLRVSSGVPNTEKQMKARGRRPSAFIVFGVWNP